MSGEKDGPKRMCMQPRYLYLSQFFSHWLRRKIEMSDGKGAQRVRTSLRHPLKGVGKKISGGKEAQKERHVR